MDTTRLHFALFAALARDLQSYETLLSLEGMAAVAADAALEGILDVPGLLQRRETKAAEALYEALHELWREGSGIRRVDEGPAPVYGQIEAARKARKWNLRFRERAIEFGLIPAPPQGDPPYQDIRNFNLRWGPLAPEGVMTEVEMNIHEMESKIAGIQRGSVVAYGLSVGFTEIEQQIHHVGGIPISYPWRRARVVATLGFRSIQRSLAISYRGAVWAAVPVYRPSKMAGEDPELATHEEYNIRKVWPRGDLPSFVDLRSAHLVHDLRLVWAINRNGFDEAVVMDLKGKPSRVMSLGVLTHEAVLPLIERWRLDPAALIHPSRGQYIKIPEMIR